MIAEKKKEKKDTKRQKNIYKYFRGLSNFFFAHLLACGSLSQRRSSLFPRSSVTIGRVSACVFLCGHVCVIACLEVRMRWSKARKKKSSSLPLVVLVTGQKKSPGRSTYPTFIRFSLCASTSFSYLVSGRAPGAAQTRVCAHRRIDRRASLRGGCAFHMGRICT